MNILELKKEFNSDIGNTMFIELYYDLGGINIFSENTEKRGYRLNFYYAFVNGVFKKTMPMDSKNFRVLVKEVKRKNKKVETKLVEEVKKYQEELFKAFSENDKEKVLEIINSFDV